MISVRRSRAKDPNDRVKPIKRPEGGIEAAARDLAGGGGADGLVLLVGGVDVPHFRLRVAQSHVRRDLTPGTWSHAGLLVAKDGRLVVEEVPLDPPNGFRDMPQSNGIQTSPLARYDDVKRFPNVAVLRFEVDAAQVATTVERVRSQRGLLDLPATILPWLGFTWGAGAAPNPLLGGTGIPSAVFVEAVFAALGVELTPGLATRSSCPEAIWQAARWWHDFYAERGVTAGGDAQPRSEAAIPSGVYWVGQDYAAVVPETTR